MSAATANKGSGGSGGGSDADEKSRLIASFPYSWPWGQTIDFDFGKGKIKVQIPDRPGTKQHKLAYNIDPAPPEVPAAPSYFTGPTGKAAHGLFNAALKSGESLETIKDSLSKFTAAFEVKRDIKIQLMNPRTSAEDKLTYIRQLSKSLGCSALITEHLIALQKEKKLHKIKDTNKAFGILVSEHRKEKQGAIISAEPLSEKHYTAIYEKMKQLLKPGEQLTVTREIDPSLIRGFMIRVGNRIQDLSVQAQILRMEGHLKQFFAKNKTAADKVLVA